MTKRIANGQQKSRSPKKPKWQQQKEMIQAAAKYEQFWEGREFHFDTPEEKEIMEQVKRLDLFKY